jgi:predicted nuclease with TOPRIM domain
VPSDEQINEVIERLEEEREALRSRERANDPTLEADAARVEEIRVELDQLWDLLRQRRALRDAGQDPDQAHERSPDIVERYWQ